MFSHPFLLCPVFEITWGMEKKSEINAKINFVLRTSTAERQTVILAVTPARSCLTLSVLHCFLVLSP